MTDKRGKGRPPKPADEKYIEVKFGLPPDVAAALRARVPDGERSAFVAGLVRSALAIKQEAAE